MIHTPASTFIALMLMNGKISVGEATKLQKELPGKEVPKDFLQAIMQVEKIIGHLLQITPKDII